ncbi:MAG TPA: riboflavin synthase [Chthonomonadaceae bacterium]|nr:riboflavin synthase [Chthonomonadaceae bacterium]
MFTGLVEEKGTVVEVALGERSARLTMTAPTVHVGAQLGDSIAVNGCCLTVIGIDEDRLTFDAVPETLHRTNLGNLCPGYHVNLERPLAVGARLGGHFVQGHIDGVGIVLAVQPDDNAVILEIGAPPELRRYFVEKGSVTVDGVSLTVAEVRPGSFTVWTIPHTREVTTLGERKVGDRVNLECDLLGKYIERLLADRLNAS